MSRAAESACAPHPVCNSPAAGTTDSSRCHGAGTPTGPRDATSCIRTPCSLLTPSSHHVRNVR